MTGEPGSSLLQPGYPGQVDLRASPNDVRDRLRVPFEPNTFVTDGTQETLWLGPDEWLLVTAPDGVHALMQRLRDALGETHHSVVDVTANRAVLDLTGGGRLAALAQGCSVDLSRRAWRTGKCAQTLLAAVPVILQERDAGTRVFVRPSYLTHLMSWLADVRR